MWEPSPYVCILLCMLKYSRIPFSFWPKKKKVRHWKLSFLLNIYHHIIIKRYNWWQHMLVSLWSYLCSGSVYCTVHWKRKNRANSKLHACGNKMQTYIGVDLSVFCILIVHFKVEFRLGDGHGSLHSNARRDQLAGCRQGHRAWKTKGTMPAALL